MCICRSFLCSVYNFSSFPELLRTYPFTVMGLGKREDTERTGGNKNLAFIHLRWRKSNLYFFFLSPPTEFEVVGKQDGRRGEDI